MKTRITELFGIEYPIICGAMFYFSEPKLAAAISNAGGLGNITSGTYQSGEELRAAIRECRELTDKPFAVNITMLPSNVPPERYDDFYRVCCEEKVAVIEASGAPATKYIEQVHEAGVKIMHKVGCVHHAKNIEKYGYDAVIAAGFEEGGHPLDEDVTAMVLTPRIAEEVSIPVIMAGGVGDGRALAAALALGADGVLMATRFLMTEECRANRKLKDSFVASQENDTSIICKTTGLQGRTLDNKLTAQVKEIEARGGGFPEIRPLITGSLMPGASEAGDVNGAVWFVGQSIGLAKEIVPVKQVIDDMVAQAKAAALRATSVF